MLEMRPNCENCDCDLPASSDKAYICSFECTFCETCATSVFHLTCPNCKGAQVKRPSRVGEALIRFPASTKRVLKKS
jgi:hypothetical protein